MYKHLTNEQLIQKLNDKRYELDVIETEDLRGRHGEAYNTVIEEYRELETEWRKRTEYNNQFSDPDEAGGYYDDDDWSPREKCPVCGYTMLENRRCDVCN